MRPYTPGTVQEWCFDLRDPTHPKTVCNAIHTITPVTPNDTPAIAASQSCFATVLAGQLPAVPGLPTPQLMPCANYQVTWLIWQPIVAIPSGSTGTIVYQIAASQQSGTVNTQGACLPDPAIPIAPTTMQQGSFSNGIIAAGLRTWGVDGQPVESDDLEPNAQWNLAAAPGLAVMSTSGIAHAVTPSGLCIVESAEQGRAQFSSTDAGKLRVAWLRDGWCPGGLGSATMLGACSPLGLTVDVGTDKRGTACSAVPTEDVRALATAVMSWWSARPTVQGGQ